MTEQLMSDRSFRSRTASLSSFGNVRLREPLAGGRPRRGWRSSRAGPSFATVQVRPEVSFQVRPSFSVKTLASEIAAILVALQAHALAARHFGHLA